MEKAVIDRIEEELAVLLVGEAEREVVVPFCELPSGASEGVWLRVELDSEHLVWSEVDEEETERRKARINDKMAQLRRKGRGLPRG